MNIMPMKLTILSIGNRDVDRWEAEAEGKGRKEENVSDGEGKRRKRNK